MDTDSEEEDEYFSLEDDKADLLNESLVPPLASTISNNNPQSSRPQNKDGFESSNHPPNNPANSLLNSTL